MYNSSRATLKETFTAKYNDDGVLSRTPLVRPKSQIYTPKGDDEHPRTFHMSFPFPPPPPERSGSGVWNEVNGQKGIKKY